MMHGILSELIMMSCKTNPPTLLVTHETLYDPAFLVPVQAYKNCVKQQTIKTSTIPLEFRNGF